MCIDADTEAHRPSNTSAALMILTSHNGQMANILEQISTEEFAHSPLSEALLAFGTIPPVSATEAAEAIARLKSRKVK